MRLRDFEIGGAYRIVYADGRPRVEQVPYTATFKMDREEAERFMQGMREEYERPVWLSPAQAREWLRDFYSRARGGHEVWV